MHYALPTRPQFFHSSARDDRDDSLIVATVSALLSERATAKPGVSISDDPSSITVSELIAVVLVTDADHVAVRVYEAHYSDRGVGDQAEFCAAISEIRNRSFDSKCHQDPRNSI